MAVKRPRIGITPDLDSGRVVLSPRYLDVVAQAGGVPLVLPPCPELAEHYVELCDGIILSGGDDPIMDDWGQAMHEQATPVDRRRQDFERAILAALTRHPERPALGVCLGMQLMGLENGGVLDQHLPDTLASANDHLHDNVHGVQGEIGSGVVTSHHHQALSDPGSMRIIARGPDGVIEGVDLPDRRFFVGVQWHPERTEDEPLGLDLIRRLLAAC